MREKVLNFGKTMSLVGILTNPPDLETGSKPTHWGQTSGGDRPAVIFLNSGLLHRVGPGRLYVKMARELASNGFVVLRFDFSGIGDSKVCDNNIAFHERAVSETQEAMNYLSAAKGIDRFILAGICSGADIAFKTACRDQRIVGIAPINAPFHFLTVNEALQEYVENRHRARCYWKINASNPSSWLRILKGQANYKGILKTINYQIKNLFHGRKKMLAEQDDSTLELGSEAIQFKSDFDRLVERNVKQVFIYSEADRGLDYLETMLGNGTRELGENGKFKITVISNTDHIFTPISAHEKLVGIILDWVRDLAEKREAA